mmetsp:Transcript_9382/g.17655  ORF Transcript_9382/g.17655 Transcript_9382/m.17655 type:complete len:642 (+) Transcript_9382:185-2110(+)
MFIRNFAVLFVSLLLPITPPTVAFSVVGNHGKSLVKSPLSPSTPTALYGKLWDKLQIEPDTIDDEPGWYVMNCVAGLEMELLAQAKHVTKDLPPELIEKIVVPTERKLRSHGATQKVVEMKVMYPGYCFVKMRCCAETYEPLQQLPLCRSWMAGTVNQKGYKKLPPAPICLSDEEVSKFKGLEEATDKIYEKFGEEYTGRGDSGQDLIAQYEGYDVGNMVKILSGNYKGEDGVVKRLKDGEIMVRMFTYGNVNDQWFKPNEIRPMTDAEAMKGLGGPMSPVNQEQFDVSIGKRAKRERTNSTNLRSDLYSSMDGRGQRNRREDRINRGERGAKGIFGKSDQELAEEEQNWRQYREEQRAEQQQRRGDMWGIKERSSWDAGDDAASFDTDGKWKSGRESRRERNKRESQNVADAISEDTEWDLFASDVKGGSLSSSEEDDFFNKLMSELSQNVDPSGKDNAAALETKKVENDDDFFASLMSELSDTPQESNRNDLDVSSSKKTLPKRNEEDDFFANLEADLSESLNRDTIVGSTGDDYDSDDDFFSNLEADLSEELSHESNTQGDHSRIGEPYDVGGQENVNDDMKEDILKIKQLETNDTSNRDGKEDFITLTVNELKELLKKRGLKVSGKKSELIERLMQS